MEERPERWFDALNPPAQARRLRKASTEGRWRVIRELWELIVAPLILIPLSIVGLGDPYLPRVVYQGGFAVGILYAAIDLVAVVIWLIQGRRAAETPSNS